MEGLPAPPGAWIRVIECPGRKPNWTAEVAIPLPQAMAERWTGALAQLQWNLPGVDFSDATEDCRGVRSLTREMSAINRGEKHPADRGHEQVEAVPGRLLRRNPKSGIGWLAGVPVALALLAAAFIAMAE